MTLVGFEGQIRLEVYKLLYNIVIKFGKIYVCFSLILPFSGAQVHNIRKNCLKLVLFIPLVKLLMEQETMVNEDEEVFSSRPTRALLPPKEQWFTSPELIEMFTIWGRLGSDIPSSYIAKGLGKAANLTQNYPTP